MITVGILALLAGTAYGAAGIRKGAKGYLFEWNPMMNDFFSFGFHFGLDLGYSTDFGGSSDEYYNNQQWGLELYSNLKWGMMTEYFGSYLTKYEYEFIPFQIKPYTQQFDMSRPESGQESNAIAYGSYDITVAKFVTHVTKNAKNCGTSFIDGIQGDKTWAPSCKYDKDSAVHYVDEHLSFEPLQDQDWYGQTTLWLSKLW